MKKLNLKYDIILEYLDSFYYLEDKKINEIKENISKKRYDLAKFDNYIIKIFKLVLTVILFLSIISDALWTFIFNNDNGYILFIISNLSLFYITYCIIIKIYIGIINEKKIYPILLVGISLKCLLLVPLIKTLYRLGYNLLYGEMLSSIIAYFVVIILLLICGSGKIKVDFIKKFDKILNAVYYNIIYCVILLSFSLIVPLKVESRLEGLKVIIIYLIISIIYIFIRRMIDKNERIYIKNRK